MAQKPTIPKGTRDFGPAVMARRDYIFNTIKEVFKLYGFEPIETPAMENLSTLTGKYGDEGDKLLFRILNSGDFLSGIEDIESQSFENLSPKITEKGLRYDLTVPFARFVVQYRNDISFPFRRYQIQPVWRADRPQKGRYREFYQCDVDVVGSDALINEAELVQLADDVFNRLKINVVIKINNRKVLAGLAEYIGRPDALIDITIAIDKLDKIGIDQVNAELREKGLSDEAVELLQPVLFMEGTTTEKLTSLEQLIGQNEIGAKGIAELRQLFAYLENMNIEMPVELDLTLARGLNYYTGAIFEVKALDVPMGSICGGGRYDNLTGVFGMPDVSGVGISFGADRIFDVMQSLDLFPEKAMQSTQIIFLNFGAKELAYCLPYLQNLRSNGYSAEIYPDEAKIKKQLRYADQKQIPIVIMAGESEMDNNQFTVKQMQSGQQWTVSKDDLIEKLSDL
ncbi:MAG: histidine--tRNA ligase [Bacteroidales bacterium]|jgi:histidyl-tRNA synthetase|nr:histidine--tRNA ligase [Bacteroidales bacterium]MDN5350013.1 histidyl-tRNA synthetase [Bacteroidales bacterium]